MITLYNTKIVYIEFLMFLVQFRGTDSNGSPQFVSKLLEFSNFVFLFILLHNAL